MLAYYLLAVTYIPPGNMSTTLYLHGTTIGSQIQLQTTSGDGLSFQFMAPAVQFSGSFIYSDITGEAFQMTSNGSWGPQVTANTDLPDHLNDLFWLWTNPQMTVQNQNNNQTVTSLQPPPGQPVNVVAISLGELLGYVTTPAYKAAQLGNLTSADRSAIVKTDPFFNTGPGPVTLPAPVLDPTRFVYLNETWQVNGPDHQHDPTYGAGFDTSTQQIHGIISGYQNQVTVSIMGGGTVSFITSASAFIGTQYQFTYQKTTQSNTGTITDAQGLLESNTVCWHQDVDVYWDGAFGTYLFQPKDNGSSDCNVNADVVGMVRNLRGRPVANAHVTGLVLPGGTTWHTSTDIHGVFKFYHLLPRAKLFHVSVPKGSDVILMRSVLPVTLVH
ncbi:carboxypeptidase-like regulatory domain-containing protein [Caballeronia sordidicola]|nr:carboxypeptidase-like regulatory domain-containing protein [Caballeronia sordidicola]